MSARVFGVAAALAAPLASLVVSGVAHASSPDVVGQKYSDASGALSGAGYSPVVETTVGDRESWSDCVVTRQQDRNVQAPPNTGGSAAKQTLVSLNCDKAVASATAPGSSAGSPEGRAAIQAAQQQAAQDQAQAASGKKH
ncbi:MULTISPECIES: hypothetical protein [unclassified Mycolicibacterium]|uniref:hypothetical protein n=1 Tax=unclassified Mycolicibacterium TaxID=2636767 RepID=UPI0012DC90DF|nr:MULTISPECIES: hypothetical protein [unclassified Mycolicibacterium]MUL81339.1 hypothetical protein [Mycolicibacterium sp. CBMA 329]MUL87105.1 hypothetical protein [Mycolicibacterium sp. CBMA 331]MUL98613.1 hypothetical protein [Mycolicibacterium sp. CBMA 334]MUM29490.1 hypothetical protein [Mycolicibacterium sp. CBMA 295]MUM37402.1 hypothetical protein [Mycolicibacterium sp. CBMA 247]